MIPIQAILRCIRADQKLSAELLLLEVEIALAVRAEFGVPECLVRR